MRLLPLGSESQANDATAPWLDRRNGRPQAPSFPIRHAAGCPTWRVVAWQYPRGYNRYFHKRHSSPYLSSRKLRRPLLDESAHALAPILGFKTTHLGFDFVLQHLFQSVVLARVNRLLGRRDRHARPCTQSLSQFLRLGFQFFRSHDPID